MSQVVVMGPCTFLVTAMVTQKGNKSVLEYTRETYAKSGIKGFYPGGTAIAFRQATNWASRQGFTELIREQMKVWLYNDKKARLSVKEEALAGVLGGTISCWNQPFEVARIQMQAAAIAGEKQVNMMQVCLY